MIRKLETLGIAMIAVLAMSALAAPAAEAVPSFTCSAYPCSATGDTVSQPEIFTTEAGTIECDGHFEGSLSAASSTMTFSPSYLNCLGFGFLNASVDAELCTYVLHATEQTTFTAWSSHFDISCPFKESIKIVAGTCKAEIKSQTGLTSVRLENAAGSIALKPNVSGISMTVTQDGFGCPFNGTGTKTASYHNVNGVLVYRNFGGTISISGS